MSVKLRWHVGKGDGSRQRLDVPPYRAYFHWFTGEQLVESQDFGIDDLPTEVDRRRALGEDVAPFEAALRQLRNLR